MRVLFWSELFWPYIGGAEVFASNLLLALQERAYELIVVTRQDSSTLPSKDTYKGIPIYRFPCWATLTDRKDVDRLMLVRREVCELKRAFSPDLVHIQGFGPTSMLFHLSTRNVCPAPLLLTLINEVAACAGSHDSIIRLLRLADWVTGKATAVLSQARQLVPEITPRSSVIQNGLEEPLLVPQSLPFNNPILLCLGRLTYQKGFDIALGAFAPLAARFPGLRMTIAGDGHDRLQLESQAADMGLKEAVDFIGWVPPEQVPQLINTATIIVMPSRWEGLPSVALQAAMMARPIVATPVGGLSEVVVHQQTGLLVPPDDHSSLAQAIAFLLERPEAAVQMGQSARRRVQEAFGWERCVDAYDALYRKLGRQRPSE
jgi:glycogen(starch) synthase